MRADTAARPETVEKVANQRTLGAPNFGGSGENVCAEGCGRGNASGRLATFAGT